MGADLVRYQETVVAVLARELGASESEQPDRVQTVWLHALRTLRDSGVVVEDMPAWLATIAFRVAIDAVRAKKRRRRLMVELPNATEWVAAPEPSAERTAHLRDLIAKLWAAAKTMPRAERVVFDLHVSEGLKHATIAERLSITEAASKMRYSRALKHLRDQVPQLADEAFAVLPPVPSIARSTGEERNRRRLRSLYDTTAPLALLFSTLWAAFFASMHFRALQSARVYGDWPVLSVQQPAAPCEESVPPSAPSGQPSVRAVSEPVKIAKSSVAHDPRQAQKPESESQKTAKPVERTAPRIVIRLH